MSLRERSGLNGFLCFSNSKPFHTLFCFSFYCSKLLFLFFFSAYALSLLVRISVVAITLSTA